MLENLFVSSTYQASKVLLDVSTRRHQVLASNLANVETPGYKRMDIDPAFKATLDDSVLKGDIDGLKQLGEVSFKPVTGLPGLGPNGNNVSIDREMMLMNENSLEYIAMGQFVSSSLNQLKMAITGRSQ